MEYVEIGVLMFIFVSNLYFEEVYCVGEEVLLFVDGVLNVCGM